MTFNNKYSFDDIKSSLTLNNLVVLLVFLFPITAATVKGAGDLIMFTLLIIGIISFRFKDLKLLDKDKYIFIGFFALFLVAVLSMINTENTIEGLKKLERLIEFPLSIFIYLCFVKRRLNLTQTLLNGVMVAAVILALQAQYDVSALGLAYASGAYHKIVFGDIAMLITVILVVKMYFKVGVWRDYLMTFFLVLSSLYASYLSGTRGAWLLGFVMMIGYFVYLVFNKNRKHIHMLFVLFVLMGFIVLLFKNDYMYSFITKEFLNVPHYFMGIGAENSTSNFQWRIVAWKRSIDIWLLNPVLGTGVGDFQSDFFKFFHTHIEKSRFGHAGKHAHSIYFDALATMGGAGLVVMVFSLFVFPLQWVRRNVSVCYLETKKLYVLTLVIIISFAVFGISEGLLSRKVFVNTYLIFLLVIMSNAANLMRGYNSRKG